MRELEEMTPLSILNHSIREMMRDLRDMEAPFLNPVITITVSWAIRATTKQVFRLQSRPVI